MNDCELKQCPYCGQFLMCEPDDDPKTVCSCDGAKKYVRQNGIYEARKSALKKLCGEGCEEIAPEYKAVSDDAFELLDKIVHGVAFNIINKTSVALPDGTTLKITADDIERAVTIKAKLTN